MEDVFPFSVVIPKFPDIRENRRRSVAQSFVTRIPTDCHSFHFPTVPQRAPGLVGLETNLVLYAQGPMNLAPAFDFDARD